jgi:hypothetical protein
MFIDRQGAPAARTARPACSCGGTWRSGTTCSCSTTRGGRHLRAAGAKERGYRHGPGAHGAGTAGQKIRVRNRRVHRHHRQASRSCPAKATATIRTPRALSASSRTICAAPLHLGDEKGVTPSNVDQGYVLRRLIRRAVRFALQLGIPEQSLQHIAKVVIAQYCRLPRAQSNESRIISELNLEEERFSAHHDRQGLREFEKSAKQDAPAKSSTATARSGCTTPSASPLSSRWSSARKRAGGGHQGL